MVVFVFVDPLLVLVRVAPTEKRLAGHYSSKLVASLDQKQMPSLVEGGEVLRLLRALVALW